MTERRTALVTGANRGIGLEVCRQLARQGHDVILTARDGAKAKAAAARLRADGSVAPAVRDAIGRRGRRYDRLACDAACRRTDRRLLQRPARDRMVTALTLREHV